MATEGFLMIMSSAGIASSILSIHSVSMDFTILLLVRETLVSAEPTSIAASSNGAKSLARDLNAEKALDLTSS